MREGISGGEEERGEGKGCKTEGYEVKKRRGGRYGAYERGWKEV